MSSTSDIFATILPELIAAMPDDHAESGYALPDATLECLDGLVRRGGFTKIFEFGSGRSTKRFLEAGCEVTCLEDSQQWLDASLKTIAPPLLAGSIQRCSP